MPDDLTIPGPLRMVWRKADDTRLDDGLYLGPFCLGGVCLATEGRKRHWRVWMAPVLLRASNKYHPTETAARAALVAAVREAPAP